ncbi:MAG: tubulin-like doman-containing protein [Corynebacterium sp.]|uniref:tubulin-like doman-containing protein n=1 Tax=Corynebacterium sp. TaxID=1720 RepID=UPI0026DB69F6|nr:tubulin-like doman-containing protein [Corynebacterium sp.]MDO4760617.1 tubulin-like doman-containing protein [Corynebacterium sp.]
MRKFLIVGCGGSGAKTQAYMMDQLKALIRTLDPSRTELPKAWQFVSIDVPIQPEPGPSGLPNVQQAGGHYIGIGSTQPYSTFDSAVTSELASNGGLKEVATWGPSSPTSIHTPVSDGAGQYRCLGRMLTIPSLKRIQEGLSRALDQMNTAEAVNELNELNYKITGKSSNAHNTAPAILVISSMAGGAGASMFLDVCRVLSTLPNAKPEHTGVFMMTPEVFEQLPREQMVGAWPNSLAMFGEVFATQTGAATANDAALFEALGVHGGNRHSTFARLFPIGNRMGSDKARFGDGSSTAVYRGLGRALSALMYSDKASDSFVTYSLANTGSPDALRQYLGWAHTSTLKWDGLPWGSLGYAQLSMGRDKYAEYSAQRLARAAFDRLLKGHVDPTNLATAEEQLKARIDERFPRVLEKLLINPEFRYQEVTNASIAGWLQNTFSQQLYSGVAEAETWIGSALPRPVDGQKTNEWASEIENRMANPEFDRRLRDILDRKAYAAVYEFADWFTDAVIAQAESELSQVGVPYLEAIVAQLSVIIQQKLSNGMNMLLGSYSMMSPSAKPSSADMILQPLTGNKRIHNGEAIVDQLKVAYREQLTNYMTIALAKVLLPVLDDFRVGVLARLQREVEKAHMDLAEASRKKDAQLNLADVSTTDPVAWPTDRDEKISDRFRGSSNEILITEVDNFPADYEQQLIETVRVQDEHIQDLAQASRVAARAVIAGKWETTDAIKAPENTLAAKKRENTRVNRAGWVSKHLQVSPHDFSEMRESSTAVFAALIRPDDLLERARMWINRPGYHFERFIAADLRSYMTRDENIADSEYNARIQRLRSAFHKALFLARPLAAVNSAMVQLVHNTSVTNRYTFSEIPFQYLDASEELLNEIKGMADIDPNTLSVFENSLTDAKKIQRIDIFGSYPNYSPIVFSSLLPHIANDWASRINKANFWQMRRTRSLAAALPLSVDERKAMVAGWILGVATGRIYIHNQEQENAQAYIYDGSQWLAFPAPMLTGPSQMRNRIDWMPVVLESILLAYAESHNKDNGGQLAQSLRPYWALRGIFDNSVESPTNAGGGVRHPAVDTIAHFLRTGEKPAEQGIVGTGVEDRAAMLEDHLKETLKLADNFVPSTSHGFPGAASATKEWAMPPTRMHAAKMPFYRDFAQDVVEMTNLIYSLLPQAKQVATQVVQSPAFDIGFDTTAQGPSFNAGDSNVEFKGFGGGLV